MGRFRATGGPHAGHSVRPARRPLLRGRHRPLGAIRDRRRGRDRPDRGHDLAPNCRPQHGELRRPVLKPARLPAERRARGGRGHRRAGADRRALRRYQQGRVRGRRDARRLAHDLGPDRGRQLLGADEGDHYFAEGGFPTFCSTTATSVTARSPCTSPPTRRASGRSKGTARPVACGRARRSAST